MRLSIIVPAFNEEKLLPETLRLLNASMQPLLPGVELIVVDNESTDRTKEIALAAGARVVTETVKNIGAVRNRGAEAAGGETLVFFDADTFVPADLLQVIDREMSDPNCLGGAIAVSYGTFERWWLRFYSRAWTFWGPVFNMRQGAAQFCRRSAFDALGGYDEGIYLGEDIDFYWRLTKYAKQAGGTLSYIEEPKVSTSTRRFDKMTLWDTVVLTHPLYILLNWRRSKPWGRWYDGSVR
jgi:glycosyltransferase involved in cell wall biosynthesis